MWASVLQDATVGKILKKRRNPFISFLLAHSTRWLVSITVYLSKRCLVLYFESFQLVHVCNVARLVPFVSAFFLSKLAIVCAVWYVDCLMHSSLLRQSLTFTCGYDLYSALREDHTTIRLKVHTCSKGWRCNLQEPCIVIVEGNISLPVGVSISILSERAVEVGLVWP